ncbi:MAG: heavy metal sensor histidine kinase [Gammaproteobacteria bacterium]|nr:heavy metal sensor histidine kinase [Gammaproteobacteria bacterium]MBU1646494.1 heavy metal sensor histidine kinase [Gammaproteobacteria bacterium]MBU1971037.1 heavy metal sensor histidine kinase [Gammaproteobacteria bacterium]
MNIRSLSITLRLTLFFSILSTGVLLVLGLLVGHAVERHFVEQDMELLQGKTLLVGNLLRHVTQLADLDELPRQLEDSLVGHHELAVRVAGRNGQRVFATHAMDFPATLLDAATADGQPRVWLQAGHPWRGIASLQATGIAGQPPLLVAVGVGIAHHASFMASFRRTLWLLIVAAATLSGFLGWVAVRRGLAPLREIRAGAARVTASHLDYRIDVHAVPVELATLAESLNAMLARLEASFNQLKEFSSDIAHELRTPISNLMTETQVALTRVRSTDEYRETLASNLEEFERLARMISDMLFLAQADHGLIVPKGESVDLAEQVAELCDFFDALAEEKQLHLSSSGTAQVTGDRLMLRRALANVLANAIRHTPAGGNIRVRIKTSAGVSVEIENDGEPIPDGHLPRLFDRFYRADPSRHNMGEGAGLGLAITRSILRAHGGDINVRSGAGSVCFELRFS